MNAITFSTTTCSQANFNRADFRKHAIFQKEISRRTNNKMMSSSLLEGQGSTGVLIRAKVMLVEDSALIRDALTDALSLSSVASFDGFATTAPDAIALLHSKCFDIVVIDIELAVGTGFDVLQELNQPDFACARPVSMVLTNHAYPIYKQKAELLGVKYFFDKSMHFNEAIETIELEALRLRTSSE